MFPEIAKYMARKLWQLRVDSEASVNLSLQAGSTIHAFVARQRLNSTRTLDYQR